jgi:hypothetical protein
LHENGARHLAEAVKSSHLFQKTFETPSLSIYRFNTTTTAVNVGQDGILPADDNRPVR